MRALGFPRMGLSPNLSLGFVRVGWAPGTEWQVWGWVSLGSLTLLVKP